MATGFSRSWRSLQADRFRGNFAAILSAAALLAAWGYWAVFVPVTLMEVTQNARLEVASAAFPIESPAAGRVVTSELSIGRVVRQGDILLVLEANRETFALDEQKARIAAIAPQIDRARAEGEASRRAGEQERQSSAVSTTQAEERVREAEASAGYAETEGKRLEALYEEGLNAVRDLEKGRSEALRLRSAASSARMEVLRLKQEQQTRDREREVNLERLGGNIARMEGERRSLEAGLPDLRDQVARRVVRAPASGTIGEAAVIRTGSFLSAGQKLGAVLPSDSLRIIAEFTPAGALGKIHAGQPARMRLDGYPWAEYGVLQACVTRVAGEVRDGTVRVELAILNSPALKAPLRHGLPGSLEVQMEQIPPARLALRIAGRNLASPGGQ